MYFVAVVVLIVVVVAATAAVVVAAGAVVVFVAWCPHGTDLHLHSFIATMVGKTHRIRIDRERMSEIKRREKRRKI
jgi:hypothetical protein